jgi:glutathione peroxidase
MTVLDNELGAKGLKILAFPCNQFANEEPGTEAEIKKFAESFGDKFQMMSKIDVNGKDLHPVYHWLRSNSECWNGSEAKLISWNFSKFLVDRNGTVTKYIEQHPFPAEFRAELESLIA